MLVLILMFILALRPFPRRNEGSSVPLMLASLAKARPEGLEMRCFCFLSPIPPDIVLRLV